MWSAVLQDAGEREAFTSLMDEYFRRPPPPHASTTTARSPSIQAHSTSAPLPPRSTAPTRSPRASASQGTPGGGLPRREEEGPKRPSGLSSTKTVVGGFDASNKKSLTKAVFSSKGPMNRAEMEKKASVGPLYVKPTTSTKPLVLPPRRAGTGAQGDDRARALYDYEGQEAEDLPVREGEELVIVERVSSDWLRCRNTSGSTGLIPTSYVEQM